MLNQLNLGKHFILSNKLKNRLNYTELIILNCLTLNFCRVFCMDITQHISPLLFCSWVWKPGNTLLMSCNRLSLYWYKFLLIISFPKNDTDFFSLLKSKFQYIKHNFFPVMSMIFYLWKSFLNAGKSFMKKKLFNSFPCDLDY